MHARALSYPSVDGSCSRIVSTESQRREQALASVRLVLAIGFALYLIGAHAERFPALYPAHLPPPAALVYIAYSVILLALTRTKQEVGPALRLSAAAEDS